MATIASSCQQRTAGNRVRVLIIGAGVAGLSLAALLGQTGETPAILERHPDLGEGGYNLGLYPLGSRILHGLGLMERYLEVSTPFSRYQLGNGRGEILKDFEMGASLERFGPFQGIRRHELLDLLLSQLDAEAIQFGATVTALHPRGEVVEVTFGDGSQAEFDLVVGADGMHSATRKLILNEREFAYWDSGWGCWVAWLPAELLPPHTSAEYWGAGRMIGLYPVKDGIGAVLAGPKAAIQHDGKDGFVAHVQRQFGMLQSPRGPVGAVIEAVQADAHPFFWDLHDCRCQHWRKGRVVLLGDSACGFLPTAGIGASIAMLAAATLADELSRTGTRHLEMALDFYEQRQRKRAEAAQENSRKLGRMVFVESTPLAWGRDQLIKFYTLEQALKDIVAIMQTA